MNNEVQKRIDDELPEQRYIYPGRLLCTILDEMRELLKTLNFAPMLSLIEEVQVVANRMESAIDMNKSIIALHNEIHELKQIRKKLREECEQLIKESQELKG